VGVGDGDGIKKKKTKGNLPSVWMWVPCGVLPSRVSRSASMTLALTCLLLLAFVVFVVYVCVSVSGVLFSVGVCVCDLLIFLYSQTVIQLVFDADF